MSVLPSYRGFVMAIERVERRLRIVTAALDRAGIPYAVIGGNAVAAWVGRADPGAPRTTKDVDILVNRGDIDRVTTALGAIGFVREDLKSITLFLDPDKPNRKTGVLVVWAGERVRPSYEHAAPTVDDAVRDPASGASMLDLPALVRMKLTSFRDTDRVHIADLLGVGLIDAHVRNALPPDLAVRLAEVERSIEP